MAIQSNFPAIKPSLLLDFANTKQLDPRITFTRASTATYYDGVTTSKAEENLFLYSQDFDNGNWSSTGGGTRTANTTTAPDGNTTADTLTASVGSTTHGFYRPQTYIAADYTLSIYAKAGTYSFLTLDFTNNTGDGATFNLSTGAIGFTNASVTSSITSVGNGWYRCVITKTMTALSGFPEFYLSSSGTANGRIFNAAGTETVFLWGAQLEQRSAVTAYTATTTQAITNYIPVLQTAASGVARFDNNPTTGESLGLLIEEQRTNICLYSSDLSNAAWTKTNATITADTVVAPDGTLTGDKLVENTATSTHSTYSRPSITNGTTYALSFYIKPSGRNRVTVQQFNSSSAYAGTTLDVLTGSVVTTTGTGASASVTSVGNGWYRCVLVGVANETTASYMQISLAQDSHSSPGPQTYTGDGFSGVFVWGAQLEAGAFATSYIPTVASTVTRNADQANMTGTNFSSWYNQAEGSLYVDMTYDVSATFIPAPRFYLSSSPNTNSTGFYNSNTNTIQSSIRSNAVAVAEMSKTVTLVGNHKMSMGYKINDAAFTVDNTAALSTATPATLPLVDSFGIGGQWVGYFQNPAAVTHIKKIAYYPIRVSNTNILALTS